eukprot:scaffold29217_cov39-Prasinocladus_malaysianus.AAC.1
MPGLAAPCLVPYYIACCLAGDANPRGQRERHRAAREGLGDNDHEVRRGWRTERQQGAKHDPGTRDSYEYLYGYSYEYS